MRLENNGHLGFHRLCHPRAHEVSAAESLEPIYTCDHANDLARLAALESENEHLRMAIDSGRRIGAAIGVMMATDKVVYEDAFQTLSRLSQATNQKLRDVAEYVLLTGMLPNATRRGPRRGS